MSKIQNIKNNKNKESIFIIIIILENDLKNIRKISRNIKNEISKENINQISTKEKTSRNNSLTLDEENIIVTIIKNKQNNSSFLKICEFFEQPNLNYSKIHDKRLWSSNEGNFIFKNIIENKNRINNISEKLNSMKNPNDISTKESFLSGYINNKKPKVEIVRKII